MYGIFILEGSKNIILENTIENNDVGIIISDSNFNTIRNNNIVRNTKQAFFENTFYNHWTRNYWGKLLPSPKIIFGVILVDRYPDMYMIPIINIDLLPRVLRYSPP
jgi:parallel beta-helix repeat protein